MTTTQSTADRVYILTGSWVWDRMYLPGDEVHFTAEQEEYFLAKMPKAFRKKGVSSSPDAAATDAAPAPHATETADASSVTVIDAVVDEALALDAETGHGPAQPADSEPAHA